MPCPDSPYSESRPGIRLEGEEPSDPTGALPARKGKEAPRRQWGNRSARGHAYTPHKRSNPVNRDVAADCLRASRRPANPGREACPTSPSSRHSLTLWPGTA